MKCYFMFTLIFPDYYYMHTKEFDPSYHFAFLSKQMHLK